MKSTLVVYSGMGVTKLLVYGMSDSLVPRLQSGDSGLLFVAARNAPHVDCRTFVSICAHYSFNLCL